MAKQIFDELELLMRRIHVQTFNYGRTILSKYNLSNSQFNIIVYIYFHGAKNLKELCEELVLAPSTISEMLVRMEESDLVKKERNDIDKRKIAIDITDRSREIVNTVIKKRVEFVKRLTEKLPQDQLDSFKTILTHMVECLQ